MTLFDAYIVVDWSARSVPSPARPVQDAIWVGERLAEDTSQLDVHPETYWRTRHACIGYLRARLLHHAEAGRRVFLGFDFGYGYPEGFARAIGLQDDLPPWRQVWNELSHLVRDDEANANNRFEVASALNARCGGGPGPLWGCPIGMSMPDLRSTSPVYPYALHSGLSLERLRWADKRMSGVQPAWKLYGNGSVGSQILLGLPIVARLRDDSELASISRVWPFETGFTPKPTPDVGPLILHVEVWPGVVSGSLDPAVPIRDQAQVRATVDWLASADRDGGLGPLFDVPPALPAAAVSTCINEEGWILGAGLIRKSRPSKAILT